MDLTKIKKIYMIGIKGVGMTMLAQFLHSKGFEISGSDTEETFMTDEILKNNGIKLIEGFSWENVPSDADLIIYSSAYNKDTNMEVARVLSGNFKVLTYAEGLAEVFNQYYGIAVCGSHGKTTTTAWLGYVLMQSGLKPNVMVGSSVPQFEGAGLTGSSDYLVVEMDEYQNKFKHFYPKIVLLNNIEYDHPDFFETEESYVEVFVDFIKKIPRDGILIANFDDPTIKRIANVNCQGKVIGYSMQEASDYVAYDYVYKDGKNYFKVKLGVDEDLGPDENMLGSFVTSLIGKHNVYNGLAVITTCLELGLELKDIRTYLEEFTGTVRRMQLLGKYKGAEVIDDYAHHPTEIRTTIEALRAKYKDKKIKVVFHPHTFSRTKYFLDEFADSLSLADEVIVPQIYGSAREEQGGVSSRDIVDKINKKEKKAKYIATLEEVENDLRENVSGDEVIVLMGAGDVFRVGGKLVG